MDDLSLVRSADQWLDRTGPEMAIVASSRVRLARNLPDIIFPPRSGAEDLERAAKIIDEAVRKSATLRTLRRLDLAKLDARWRSCLKESHFISLELEKADSHRFVYISEDASVGLMVNEEDHLRMFCIMPGLQLREAMDRVREIDEELQKHLEFAFSPDYGYLSACATNTGTGMRASVMQHLPGLTIAKALEKAFAGIPDNGLTVRGYYGENSEFLGDFYQLSNERTLGKSEEEILESLFKTVREGLLAERQARDLLFREKANAIDDAIWRSYAILSSARVIDTTEAAKLLSKVRLGMERGYFHGLSHEGLNRLIVDIQPGHVQLNAAAAGARALETDQRDALRARLLRERVSGIAERN